MESARCKAFMYAADTGSFTNAAERLNYTPSGVSQLVGALENETGLTLLRRTRKGVTLTSDGEILLPAVREFLEKEMESGNFKKVPLRSRSKGTSCRQCDDCSIFQYFYALASGGDPGF